MILDLLLVEELIVNPVSDSNKTWMKLCGVVLEGGNKNTFNVDDVGYASCCC